MDRGMANRLYKLPMLSSSMWRHSDVQIGCPVVNVTAAWCPCLPGPALTAAYSDGYRRASPWQRGCQKGQGCLESAASNGRIRAVNYMLARFILIGSCCSSRLSPGQQAGSLSPLVVGELYTVSHATSGLLPLQRGHATFYPKSLVKESFIR